MVCVIKHIPVDVEGEKSNEDATYVEDQGNEADRDTNANLEGRDDVQEDVVLPHIQATQEIKDTHMTLTLVNPDGQQQSSSVSSGFVSNMLNPNQDTSVDAIFGQHAEATSLIDIHVTEVVDVAVQLKYDRIREEAHAENQQFLDSIDEGIKKVIKEQVKNEVSKITPKIKKLVNEQLKSEVLVRSSKEAKMSHAVAANLSELELKKILIDKMEANNSINRSDNQRQLYKALVDAYEADKILLDTYGDTVTIKRPRDGADDDQEPFVETDRGSKRRRSGKEPESTSAPREKTTTTAGKTTTGSKTHKQSAPVEETMQSTDVFDAPAHQEFETGVHDEQAKEEVHHLPDWFQQPKRLPSLDHAWNKSVPVVHEFIQHWLSNLARRQDPRESFDELTDTTFDFSAFLMNRLNVKTLTPKLLAGPTFELMKGTCKSLTELEYFCEEVYKATTKKIKKNRTDKMILKKIYAFATTRESARDVYSKRRIIVVTKVEIVEWKNYKHLDWITVRKDDDILYKFIKEGLLPQLRNQDIEEHAHSSRSKLRRRDAYTPYSDPKGFIYENKDKKNILMRIDELHKFSDGTLDDVRTALNDRLKGIRMEYLPQTFWSQRDKRRKGGNEGVVQLGKKRWCDSIRIRNLFQEIDQRVADESNTYVLERFNTTAGNPVKKILLKLNLSDHRLFKDGGGGIVREHEDYINQMSLLCSNSSSQSPKNFYTIIESLPTSTTLIEDNDPNREEIDIFSRPDDSIPPGIESDFDSEEDIIDNLLNDDPIHERLTFDMEPGEPVINNVDELNEDECFDPGGGEINVKVNNSFTFVTWIFLPLVTYLEVSPLLSSTKNEDTIFDPGIST
ncbi:hypothetical protein Tco_1170124 [Tanacetum coccineum]